MSDTELTRALERGEIANEGFHHQAHLHVAWVYLAESATVEEAAARMRDTLQRFAAGLGKPEKYHETITLFWLYLLGQARRAKPAYSLEQIIRENPQLLEKNLALEYYSSDRLFSAAARCSWIVPDLKPLETHATPVCPSSSARHASNRTVP